MKDQLRRYAVAWNQKEADEIARDRPELIHKDRDEAEEHFAEVKKPPTDPYYAGRLSRLRGGCCNPSQRPVTLRYEVQQHEIGFDVFHFDLFPGNGTTGSMVPVHITSTPESISTLYPVTHSKKLGKHNVMVCDDGAVGVTIPKERILQALKDLPVIDATEATVLMTDAYNHNTKLRIAQIVEYADMGAALFGATGVIKVSKDVLTALIAGIGTAHKAADFVKGQVPSLAPFLANALTGDVALSPAGQQGQCATRVVFTGIIKGVHSLDMIVQVPVPSPTSLGTIPAKVSRMESIELVASVLPGF